MPVLDIADLESTKLYSTLKELAGKRRGCDALPGNVASICREAANRLRIFPAIHGQYTLHDDVHCLRLVELMSRVLGPLLDRLNAIEIALLILSAYLHDQGMIVDSDELQVIRTSEEWRMHEEQWASDHPSFVELMRRLSDPLITDAEREKIMVAVEGLRAAMFTDYIRERHGQRSAEFAVKKYGSDSRLLVEGRSITEILAVVCRSHVLPGESITEANGFRLGELVGTVKVNVALLAFVLRLADILDFDRDRTPDTLYRAIDFASEVSLREWEKHRSVTG